MKLEDKGNYVLVYYEDHAIHQYTKKDETSYQPPLGVYAQLSKKNGNFELKDKDQNITYFDENGRLTKIVDANKNTLQYNRDGSGVVQSVTDSSGRKVTFTYTDGLLSKLTGPSNTDGTDRVIQFDYTDSLLTKVTNEEGKVYSYGYENGKLRFVYEPEHTADKPSFTEYAYDEASRLIRIMNPENKETKIAYNPEKNQATETEPKGNQNVYEYNSSGNPSKEIIDAGGLALTTTYTYEGNLLRAKTIPSDQGKGKPTETFEYDSKGNVTKSSDPLGTTAATYDQNNNLTSVTDPENKKTTTTYSGTNAVSDTDQAALTSSMTKYDSYGNVTEETDALAMGTNLLKNPSFEKDLQGWEFLDNNHTGDGLSIDTSIRSPGLGGLKSLKIHTGYKKDSDTSTNNSYAIATQSVELEENQTYTLSAWIRTQLTEKSGAYLETQILDAKGDVLGYRANNYNKVFGTTTVPGGAKTLEEEEGEWKNRQVSFKTPKGTARAKIYLVVFNEVDSPGGTAWFDKVQLETGLVSSPFNPVENSSFEDDANGWTRWSQDGSFSYFIGRGFDQNYSLYMKRNSVKDPTVQFKQKIQLNQKYAKPITLTGISRAQGVKNDSDPIGFNKDYSLWGKVFYRNDSGELVQDNIQAKFPIDKKNPDSPELKDWNRSSVTLDVGKPIEAVEIYTIFQNNNVGEVWFDAIRLIEGKVITQKKYDQDGNYVTQTIDEIGNTTAFTYDNYGNKLTEQNPKGNTKSSSYYKDNKLKQVKMPDGTTVDYGYDNNGNTIRKTVQSGEKQQVIQYLYDKDNKPILYKDALGRETKHEYDANSNKTKTVQPNGNTFEWEYDTANRPKSLKRNDKLTYEYTYNKDGNETAIKDVENGTTRTKVYDEKKRLKSMDIGDDSRLTWEYENKTTRVKTSTLTAPGLSQKLEYEYNTQEKNTSVTDGNTVYRFNYDEAGNVHSYIAGNGTGVSYTYDETGKVKEFTVGGKKGKPIWNEKYTYDKNGNRETVQRGSYSFKYEYDSRDQLIKENLYDGTSIQYTYDGFGNRTKVETGKPDGSRETVEAAFDDKSNELIQFGSEKLTYDKNGNRTSDGTFTYTWDAADQLIAVSKVGASTPFVTYKYDDKGRRIQKTVDGETTRFYYDGDSINLLYETDGSGKVLRSYVYGDNGARLAMKVYENGAYKATLTYHYNVRGDVIALTDETEGGTENNIAAQYDYDSWGNIIRSDEQPIAKGNPFKYAGYMHDKETNQYYLMARYYHGRKSAFTGGLAGANLGFAGGGIAARAISSYRYSRAISTELKRIGKTKKAVDHIMKEKHAWNKVIRGKVTFRKVSRIMKKTMKRGKETELRKPAYKRVLKTKGQRVRVHYAYVNGKIRISDAWVITRNTR